MAVRKHPSLRAFWLGQRLRQLREGVGLNLKEVGAFLQRDQSTVSRFESGEYPARRVDVGALLDLYRVDDADQRRRLTQLAAEVWQTGWWDDYAKDVRPEMVDLAWLEARTAAIRWYSAVMVPGLLQTARYAENVVRIDAEDATEEQVHRWVQLRLDRQCVLDRNDSPELSALLDESVLYRPFGGTAVLHAQLDHLLDVAARPNVRLRILPHDAAVHAGDSGMFILFDMPEPYPPAAYTETLAGGLYVESEQTERFARAYDRLATAALDPKESVALIDKVAKEM